MQTILNDSQLQSYVPSNVSGVPAQNLSFFYNVIIGTPFDDVIPTTFLNDFVVALGGNDTILGSFGNDIFVGGSGNDTADYSNLGQAITLKAGGVVNKGSFGTDKLYEIENVIGTSQGDTIFGDNNNNVLDGRGGNDTVFGLGGNDTVRGGAGNDVIGGGNKGNIFISKFSDGNDILEGGSGNDSLIGGTGNDTLDGGTGFDTADYTHLYQAITLEAKGIVNKGSAGTDEIIGIERIIAAKGRANSIDGSTGTSTTTSFNVNLAKQSLVVNGVPGLGALKFQVQNFVNVTGTSQADSIIGNNQSNILEGGRGNDTISGLAGKDTLIGVDSKSFSPGRYEVDILTGGADADKFVVGDAKNAYYKGGGGFFGLNDFAFITDFETGEDKLELNKSQSYIFGQNFIAVSNFFKPYPLPYEMASDNLLSGGKALLSDDLDSSVADSAVADIISNNGAYDTLSLGAEMQVAENSLESSSLFIPFPSFDIIAIVADNYSYNDIHFV